MRIGILGMGGIGSFIGAKLARNCVADKQTEIIFICRGKTKENIQKDGLSLTSQNATIKAHPSMASNDPEEIGLLDILIVATKSYSLVNAIQQYQNCIKKDTIIIPVLNGVNAKNAIVKNIKHDHSKILEGSIYVASNMERPGMVNHVGGPGEIFFGNNDDTDYSWVETFLKEGGLDATHTKEIKKVLWKKYLFVSPLAAMTTALDITFGELAENPEHREQLEKMMKEVQSLAISYDVILTNQDIQDSLSMVSNFPYISKSSLQLDYEHGRDKTEKEDLVDFIIEKGNHFKINVDNYREMNQKISARRIAQGI